jgi:hypothetical protein
MWARGMQSSDDAPHEENQAGSVQPVDAQRAAPLGAKSAAPVAQVDSDVSNPRSLISIYSTQVCKQESGVNHCTYYDDCFCFLSVRQGRQREHGASGARQAESRAAKRICRYKEIARGNHASHVCGAAASRATALKRCRSPIIQRRREEAQFYGRRRRRRRPCGTANDISRVFLSCCPGRMQATWLSELFDLFSSRARDDR